MADIDYYNDPSQHGQYQYVTLEQIINEYMMSIQVPGHMNANIPRIQVIYQAKRALRELYFDVLKEVQAIELELSPNLTVTLPPDYVNYVRISWVDENGLLHPMAIDNRMSLATAYLQAHNYALLFDSNGCVLKGTGVRETIDSTADLDTLNYDPHLKEYRFISGSSFIPNANAANMFTNGRYNINKQEGYIQFGADAYTRNIVLEYISDGLFSGCDGRAEAGIRVHKFAEPAVLDFINYELIKNRNVPAVHKQAARHEYYESKRRAKRRVSTLRYEELRQIFRGSSRWIK